MLIDFSVIYEIKGITDDFKVLARVTRIWDSIW